MPIVAHANRQRVLRAARALMLAGVALAVVGTAQVALGASGPVHLARSEEAGFDLGFKTSRQEWASKACPGLAIPFVLPAEDKRGAGFMDGYRAGIRSIAMEERAMPLQRLCTKARQEAVEHR